MLDRHALLASVVAALATAPALAGPPVEQAWLDRYDGPDQRTDRGFDVVFDSQGCAIVGGYTQVLVEPNTYWPYYLAIKYAPDGMRRWVRTWEGGPAVAEAIAVDHDDSVILVGSAHAGDDFGVVKYDADGTELWSRIYEVDSVSVTSFDDVAIDREGAVYAVGSYQLVVNGPWRLAVVKYAPDGTREWDVRYLGPLSSHGNAIAANDAGEAYVAGWTQVGSDDLDFMVLQVTAGGDVGWVHRSGRSGRFAIDGADDIEVDGLGNVVAAGGYGRTADESADVAVVWLEPDGTVGSVATYDGPAGRGDGARRLALDGASNAIVVGSTEVADFDDDALIVKFDADGNEIWARQYGDANWDEALDVAVDHLGHIYVVGKIDPVDAGASYFTVSYDPAGTQQWDVLYGGPRNGGSYAMAVAVAADRHVAVTGYSQAGNERDDAATICYTQPPVDPLGDLDGDGMVGFSDLLILLAAWGPCDGECPADLNGDGAVDFDDLLLLLANWG